MVCPGSFALIAVVRQNLIEILGNAAITVFQHHIQVPLPCHAVTPRRGDTHLLQHRIYPAFGDQNMVSHDGLVVLPPAAQGKGLGGLMAVHEKRNSELGTDLRLHAQQFQHMGVGGGLVSALLREASLHRVTVHPVGIIGIGVADLHMGFVEWDIRRHAQKSAQAPLVNERIVLQFLKLLLRQVLKGAVGPAPGLAEVVLLDALVDRESDGKKGRKKHRRQGDGQHRHDVPGAAGEQGAQAQAADTAAVGDLHVLRPLTASRSARPRCGRCGRPSGRSPRCG